MEENVDSIKESSSKRDDPLNKDIVDIESSNETSTLINKNTGVSNNENFVDETSNNIIKDTNKPKVDEENSNKVSNDINEKIVNEENSNKISNDINEKKVDEENSNKVSNDINEKKVDEENSKPLKIKPKKELPIEKKPFDEFIKDHLLPSIIHEFKVRGFEVADINLKNTSRPIAGDKCWVIFCEIKDICNFWLSFEKEDISSLKSISLCKSDQKPSVIESFLIDEKRITLKLIISRILQRLNGQKLIGIN